VRLDGLCRASLVAGDLRNPLRVLFSVELANLRSSRSQ
jgi:hypothetical protein